MAIDVALRAKVEARLAMGSTPRELADGEFKGDVSYLTILGWRKQMKAEHQKEQVQEIVRVDAAILENVVERAREEAPSVVVKKIEKLQDGVNGLQLLDEKFHKTMSLALSKAEEFLAQEDLKSSEWVAITNALANAYNNIFNSKGVSVNVNNGTQFSDTKLSMFKGSIRS